MIIMRTSHMDTKITVYMIITIIIIMSVISSEFLCYLHAELTKKTLLQSMTPHVSCLTQNTKIHTCNAHTVTQNCLRIYDIRV